MKFPPPDHRFLRFWTDEYPSHQRPDAWREVLSHMLLKVDLKPLPDEPFRIEATLRALNGIRFGTGKFTSTVHSRTREIVAADNNDLLLIINLEGPLSIALDGMELAVREGDAYLLSCAQVFDLLRPVSGRLVLARMEQAQAEAYVPNIMQYVGQPVLRGNEALRHLTTILLKLDDRQTLESEELRQTITAHIFTVLALALNVSRPVETIRQLPRSAVTRLSAIQKHVTQHVADQALGVASVAAANGLSPRQLQRIFEASGQTFSEFLLAERLKRVRAALLDPKQSERSVSEIALACGFGDVSYFNRAFRRCYGSSPSEVRRNATAS
ncbi:MAG TPA: helix-turn-helix transcriptional regulator [Rhizomicrobium sp.]|jgi:AraC-like DNA-binding protein|nr:helix-turn-helix transcriptional regulator [Rhizomicrobium sp.]